MNWQWSALELRHIQEACREAQERCAQRAAEARLSGKHATSAYQLQLHDHYRVLTQKLMRLSQDRLLGLEGVGFFEEGPGNPGHQV